MFNTISWHGYWITIALLTTGYYIIIYLFYFRKHGSLAWSQRSGSKGEGLLSSTIPDSALSSSDAALHPSLFDSSEEFLRPEPGTIEHAVYACMDEINAYLEVAKRSKCAKEEMLYALHTILLKYPAIAASEYKESVTNVMISQCDFVCSVHLSADDVVRVWVGW